MRTLLIAVLALAGSLFASAAVAQSCGTITTCPAAGALDGTEVVLGVQHGATVQINDQAIANLAAGGFAVAGPGLSVSGDISCWSGVTGLLLEDCGGGPPGGFSNAVPAISLSYGTNGFGLPNSSFALVYTALTHTNSEAWQVTCNGTWLDGPTGSDTSCARLITTTPAGRGPYTWGLTVVNNDYATSGDLNQPTSIYCLLNKYGTGIGIGCTDDLEDTTQNPANSSVAQEIDLRGLGGDSHSARVGSDMQLGNLDPGISFTGTITGGTTLTMSGLTGTVLVGQTIFGTGVTNSPTITGGTYPTFTISPASANVGPETMDGTLFMSSSRGYRVYTQAFTTAGSAFSVEGTGVTQFGFDSSAATISGAAVRTAAGQQICFDAPCIWSMVNLAGVFYLNNTGVGLFSATSAGVMTSPTFNATNGFEISGSALNFSNLAGKVANSQLQTATVGPGSVAATTFVRAGQTVFASLATADPTPQVGDMLNITDASACTLNVAVSAGGGTVHSCPTVYNGVGWISMATH